MIMKIQKSFSVSRARSARFQMGSAISWITTISGFRLLCSGRVIGPLYEHGYFRALLIGESLLETLSLMMTSLVSES